jgi:hypothetical protein
MESLRLAWAIVRPCHKKQKQRTNKKIRFEMGAVLTPVILATGKVEIRKISVSRPAQGKKYVRLNLNQ